MVTLTHLLEKNAFTYALKFEAKFIAVFDWEYKISKKYCRILLKGFNVFSGIETVRHNLQKNKFINANGFAKFEQKKLWRYNISNRLHYGNIFLI